MRHKKARFQLNRFTSWRKATLRSIIRNVLTHQSITTSMQKAKAVKPLIEKLVTLTKSDTISARRQAFKILGSHNLVNLLFNEIGPRFAQRQSGYTRIINVGTRRGDAASLVILEFTEIKKKGAKKPKKEIKEGEQQTEKIPEALSGEAKSKTETVVKEQRRQQEKKPIKKFMGGIRNIFKKERDSL